MEASREYDRGRCETRKCSITEAGTALLEEPASEGLILKPLCVLKQQGLQTVKNQKKHIIHQ
jgi:hypothetical protein